MTAARRKALLNVGAFGTAVIAVLGWTAPKAVAAVDARYEHADSAALLRFKDSVLHSVEMQQLRSLIARDTELIVHLDAHFHPSRR